MKHNLYTVEQNLYQNKRLFFNKYVVLPSTFRAVRPNQ